MVAAVTADGEPALTDIKRLQREDARCAPTISFLEKGSLPEEESERAHLLRIVPPYHLRDGLLYRVQFLSPYQSQVP